MFVHKRRRWPFFWKQRPDHAGQQPQSWEWYVDRFKRGRSRHWLSRTLVVWLTLPGIFLVLFGLETLFGVMEFTGERPLEMWLDHLGHIPIHCHPSQIKLHRHASQKAGKTFLHQVARVHLASGQRPQGVNSRRSSALQLETGIPGGERIPRKSRCLPPLAPHTRPHGGLVVMHFGEKKPGARKEL